MQIKFGILYRCIKH